MIDISVRTQIVRICNEGASQIEAGELEGGMVLLRNALSAAKRLIHDQQRNQEVAQNDSACCSLDQLIIFETESIRAHENDAARGGFMIRTPLRLNESIGTAKTDKSWSHMMANVIVFNLALAAHLASMTSYADPSDAKKAIQLYELAFTLQNSSHYARFSLMFQLMIVSNLAHAHSLVGDKARAEICYDQLLSTLMYVVHERQVAVSPEKDFITWFFHNTSHLIFGQQPLVAAAA